MRVAVLLLTEIACSNVTRFTACGGNSLNLLDLGA